MASATAGSGRRIDPTTVRRFLVGDVLAILLFILLGEASHGAPSPLAVPGYYLNAVAPFLLGWAVAGTLAGAYATSARTSLRRGALALVAGWLGADVVAQALRATALFHGDPALTFFLVAGAVGLALLAVARLAATLLAAAVGARTG